MSDIKLGGIKHANTLAESVCHSLFRATALKAQGSAVCLVRVTCDGVRLL